MECVTEKMHTIFGAGFAITLEMKGNLKILLIRDRLNGTWDFPKGEAEIDEPPAKIAMRELFEETGLQLDANQDCLFSPESFEYSIRPRLNKRIMVFPVLLSKRFDSEPNVLLSEEHDAYLWANTSDALELLKNKPEAATCFRRILVAISSHLAHKQSAVLASEKLKEDLPQLLATETWATMHSWYLHGSYVCAENTLSPYGFSDVDLVCVSEKNISGGDAVWIHDQANRVVKTLLNDPSMTCGIYHLHPGSHVLMREPQWTYFAAAHASLLIKSGIAPAKINIPLERFKPDPEQEIPRAIWYRLLKAIHANGHEVEYSFVKGIIALALLRFYIPSGYEFEGYSALKHRIQSDILTGQSPKVPYLSFLSALDYKLNYFPSTSSLSRRGEFIQICRDWMNDEANNMSQLTFDFCSISLDILEEPRRIPNIASLTRIARFLELPSATVENILKRLDNGDVNALELMLAVFRARHKGNNFKSAFPKYITLLSTLSSKLISQNRASRGMGDLLSQASWCISHMNT